MNSGMTCLLFPSFFFIGTRTCASEIPSYVCLLKAHSSCLFSGDGVHLESKKKQKDCEHSNNTEAVWLSKAPKMP